MIGDDRIIELIDKKMEDGFKYFREKFISEFINIFKIPREHVMKGSEKVSKIDEMFEKCDNRLQYGL